MKINEILNEGPWTDALKSMGRGVANYGKKLASNVKGPDPADRALIHANDLIKEWNNDVYRNMPAAQKSNPVAVKTLLDKFLLAKLSKDYSAGASLPGVDANSIQTYITDATRSAVSDYKTSPPPAPNPKGTPPGTPAGLAPGIVMVNKDPIILNFRKQDYIIGDTGDWQNLHNKRSPIDPAFAAFLTQQHNIILGTTP